MYLAVIALGLFGEAGVRSRIVVAGDATATTANMRALETLWRLGVAGELLLLMCAITLAVILYILIRPVSRDGALLAICFNLVSLAVEAAMALFLAAALFPLGTADSLNALQPEQLNALSMMSIRAHGFGFGLALVFFGCFCVVFGYLIYRSGYIPKAIGILMQLAGVSYLVNSFTMILSPALSAQLFPLILAPAFIGELALALWLLAKGVDPQKWNPKRSRA